MTTPEGKVKDKVRREFAKAFPTAWRFMPVQMGMGAPAHDFIYCIEGLFVSVETKVPGKHMTPRQEATAKAINDAGGMVFEVCDDKTIAEAILTIQLRLH